MDIFVCILLFLSCFLLLILNGSLYFITLIVILFCFIYFCFIYFRFKSRKNKYDFLMVSFFVLGAVLFAHSAHVLDPKFLKNASYIAFGLCFVSAFFADKDDKDNLPPP